MRRNLLIIILIAFLLAPMSQAEDGEIPTIGILNFGPTVTFNLGLKGTLDMLQAYGYFNAEERAVLNEGEDLEGDNINILWRSAGLDLPTVNLMIEDVLDRGVDAMVTLSTQVSQIAVNITRDMENPPAIVFTLVTVPFAAGIADDICIKPQNVTGTYVVIDYGKVIPLILMQDPEIKRIGTIVTPDQQASVVGANQIVAAGESLGLTVEVATAISASDLDLAIDSLADKGVEAIYYSVSSAVLRGMPIILEKSSQYGIPVFAPVTNHVFMGATVAAGFQSMYGEGVIAAQMLHAHLTGAEVLPRIAINRGDSFAVALNLDSAKAQGVEIVPDLLELADFVIEDGVASAGVTRQLPELITDLPEMTTETRAAADIAFLESLRCTPEMIAEQQAKLDAADV